MTRDRRSVAAIQDNARAQLSLGMLHMAGDGVPFDEEEGLRWLRRAAELGDPDAEAVIPGFEEMLRVRMTQRARGPKPDSEEVAN